MLNNLYKNEVSKSGKIKNFKIFVNNTIFIITLVLYLLINKSIECKNVDNKKCIPCSANNKNDNLITYTPKLYYTNNNRNVFTIIPSNKYIGGDFIPIKEKELLEYNENVFNILDQYKDEILLIKTFNDGSKLYKDSKNEILFCNSEDNNDIYFFYNKITDTNNL